MFPKYDPESMITVKEAKTYAMNRRFEVSPDERIHVCRGETVCGIAYRERLKKVEFECSWPVLDSETLLEGFEAWDKDAINMIGDKGAYRSVFDRKAFNDLFSKYPNK